MVTTQSPFYCCCCCCCYRRERRRQTAGRVVDHGRSSPAAESQHLNVRALGVRMRRHYDSVESTVTTATTQLVHRNNPKRHGYPVPSVHDWCCQMEGTGFGSGPVARVNQSVRPSWCRRRPRRPRRRSWVYHHDRHYGTPEFMKRSV